MNHFYPGQRLRIVVILSIAAFLALSSYWLSLVIQKNDGANGRGAMRNVPDYHVENFDFVKMSTKGLPRYHVNGEKMTHYPQKGTLHITLPIVKNLDKNTPDQTLASKRAILANNNSELHLYEQVQYNRAATADSSAILLKSEYLLMLLDEDIIQTYKPVTIFHGNSVLEGVGLYANNMTREFRVQDQVRIRIEPQNQE